MSRLERPTNESSNPAVRFLEWKSNDKSFSYWDKVKAAEMKNEGKSKEQIKAVCNVKLSLPLKVLFLEHYHTVKGWSDHHGSGIFANEVFGIGKEELNVKVYDNGKSKTIGEGLYKNISDKIKGMGAVYHRSIYVMVEDGSVWCIQLKGAAVGGIKKEKAIKKLPIKGYSDFDKENNHLTDNQWIEIKSVGEGKNGAVKYAIPVFEMGDVITEEINDLANIAASKLQSYVDSKKEDSQTVDEPTEAVDKEATEEELAELPI